ncbi:hypothetical protein BU16DRAFT_119690 [Lophium mytilinum]|uniref:Uncharacterized protein n=1 Tax=Lophium mytilinum TaxID=390894 RepID=A0A6A6QHC3_9PEZI|nr:hypothetical protein BU16DRAFT_119690 [Lophium mytilinum]
MHTTPRPGRPMRRIIPIAIEIPHMHRPIADLPPLRRVGRVGDPKRGRAVVAAIPEGAVASFGGEQRRAASLAGAGVGCGGGGEGAALGGVGSPLADGGCAAEVGVFGVVERELDGCWGDVEGDLGGWGEGSCEGVGGEGEEGDGFHREG